MQEHRFTVNGEARAETVPDEMPLLWVLRDVLQLTGTKYGCGEDYCGACTVLVNGKAKRSCQLLMEDLDPGDSVTTIEGLSDDPDHPDHVVQRAWIECDVPQCGYCQCGQIMQAVELVRDHVDVADDELDERINDKMSRVLCRCGTYQDIRKAIKLAVKLEKDRKGGGQ